MTKIPFLTLIHDYVCFHAETTPDKLFLSSLEAELTYADALKFVNAAAKSLMDMGIAKGDRVAWFGNPTPSFFLHFLATSSIGAIWTGLNPKYTESELAYVVGDARPKLIFAQVNASGQDRTEELTDLATSVDGTLVALGGKSTLAQAFEAFTARGNTISDAALSTRRASIDPMDPAFIVYTSGTTGRPKGALLHHKGANFCNTIAVERKGLLGRSIICNLPINHVGSLSDICGRTMTGGGTIHFQETFDPIAMMQLIEEKRIDTWGAVPAVFQMSIASPVFAKADLSSIELLAWGGARMPRDLIATLIQKTGAKACTMGYGMTETIGGVTYSRLDDTLEVLSETIGTPDPRQPIRLWHDENRLAGVGEQGEIQVYGDFVMRGYWGRPDATNDAFSEDGWLKTGDLATVRADGNLEIVGRMSEMYKSGGYNVYPREVELTIEEIDGVTLAAVVSFPDPTFQEVGHAFLLAEPGTSLTEEAIRKFLKSKLANYKIPKRVSILATLPMLPIGKVDKQALKKMTAAETKETQ